MNLLSLLVVLAQVGEAAPPPKRPPPPVGVQIDAGYGQRKLFAIPATGADFGFGVLVEPAEHMGVGGSLRGFVGGTENGLQVWDVRWLAEAEAIAFDRLHLGGGLGAFVLGVKRAARDETLHSWGPELQAHARIDLVRDDYALFVRGAVSGGYDVYDSSWFWGPSIGLGFELDVTSSRRRTDSAAEPAPIR